MADAQAAAAHAAFVEIGRRFLTESWSYLGTAAIFVFLRTFARWKVVGFRNFKPDDYLMFFALFCFTLESTAAHLVITWGGTNSYLTEEERLALSDDEFWRRTNGSKAFLLGWNSYCGTVWTLKLCMIFFFRRVTIGLERASMIKYAFAATGLTYVIMMLTLYLTCRPYHKQWQVIPDPGKKCWVEYNLYYVISLALNLSTDILIMAIPMPLLLKVKVPMRRKVVLIGMFSAGFFVMIAATLRCIYAFTNTQANGLVIAIWSCREAFVAMIVGNVPMIKPIISRYGGKWTNSSLSSSGKKGGKGGKGSNMNDSVELSSRSTGNHHSNDSERQICGTDSDSMEHIVGKEGGLEIATSKTYEVTYENNEEAGLGYTARAHAGTAVV
ncbi:uncharacterized protein LAJ45_01231 [Morchella importuna]|uniref:uncharacterized protein n=1 Tax=Morchella importuna TaxID=1174673 RepID=UPI001E8DB741|nr:uncharacterized protein LAJ45_01231 [Morchella importuna]KAH8154700.1 hypothetical protein LAJ45_01231 [Morchella importuna]